MCRHLKKRPAFTLIELLVTVAIIVIIMALLIPVLGSAKDSAKSAACMANTKTLAQAAINFATNHQGYLQPDSNDDNPGHTQTSWITAADPTHARWAYSNDPNRHAVDYMSALIPYMGGLPTDNINNMQSTSVYTSNTGAPTTTGLSRWVTAMRCPTDYWLQVTDAQQPGYRVYNNIQALDNNVPDNYYPISYGVNADLCSLVQTTAMNGNSASVGLGCFSGFPSDSGRPSVAVAGGAPASQLNPSSGSPTQGQPLACKRWAVAQPEDTLMFADCGTRTTTALSPLPTQPLDDNDCLYYTTNGDYPSVITNLGQAMTLDGINNSCPWLANRIPWNGNKITYSGSYSVGTTKYAYPRHGDAINISFVDGHAETAHQGGNGWKHVRISPW